MYCVCVPVDALHLQVLAAALHGDGTELGSLSYEADFEGPADVPAIERLAATLAGLQAIQPNLLIKFEDIMLV